MVEEQLWQLLQALVDKPNTNMRRSIFARVEGEDILPQLNKFEHAAANNNLTEEKQRRSIPL